MKSRLNQLFTLMFLILAGILPAVNTFAQNIEINGETIEISINKFKAGNIQWQFSNDKTNWKNIEGTQGEVLNHKINGNSSYRAKVTNGNCIYYSDETTIESFDFNYRDKNGNPIVSKNSEFIILIPDIQNYIYISDVNNIKYLENIIDWILKFNASGFKVKAVLQVGDITNYNSIPEWERAQKIFSKLNNKIDYMLCTGNHDYGDNGTANSRNTSFNKYFNYKNNSSFISSFKKDNFENSYFNIDIHYQPVQIFSLEFGPRNEILEWADSIAKANPNKLGIILTHAYLANVGYRYDFEKFTNTQYYTPYNYGVSKSEKINDGEEIWKKLIFPNDNINFVFCGHNLIPNNDFHIISENNFKNTVLQMIYNKQESLFGGEGLIKIIEFNEDKTTTIKSYSVLYNKWENDTIQIDNFRL